MKAGRCPRAAGDNRRRSTCPSNQLKKHNPFPPWLLPIYAPEPAVIDGIRPICDRRPFRPDASGYQEIGRFGADCEVLNCIGLRQLFRGTSKFANWNLLRKFVVLFAASIGRPTEWAILRRYLEYSQQPEQ